MGDTSGTSIYLSLHSDAPQKQLPGNALVEVIVSEDFTHIKRQAVPVGGGGLAHPSRNLEAG